MDSVYQFHENLRKLMHEDRIDIAIEKYESLGEDTKILLGIIASRMKDDDHGEITVEIETEELQNMFAFIKSKANEGHFDKPITKEEEAIFDRIMSEETLKMMFGLPEPENDEKL